MSSAATTTVGRRLRRAASAAVAAATSRTRRRTRRPPGRPRRAGPNDYSASSWISPRRCDRWHHCSSRADGARLYQWARTRWEESAGIRACRKVARKVRFGATEALTERSGGERGMGATRRRCAGPARADVTAGKTFDRYRDECGARRRSGRLTDPKRRDRQPGGWRSQLRVVRRSSRRCSGSPRPGRPGRSARRSRRSR